MYLQAATEEQKMITVTGKLVRVVGIGGESSGWAIQLESEIKIEGKPVKSIEVNHQTKRFEKLDNKRVEATGKLLEKAKLEASEHPDANRTVTIEFMTSIASAGVFGVSPHTRKCFDSLSPCP